MSRRLVGSLVMAAVAMAAGCGGGSGPSSADDPKPDVSGYFVGRSDDGLGVSVDFSGYDATSAAVREALDPGATSTIRRVEVGIVSLVNAGDRAEPVPRMTALLAGERRLRLQDAGAELRGMPGEAAEAARALLPDAGPVRAGRASTAYVVLRGRRLADLTGLLMHTREGPPTPLGPEPR